MSTTSLVSTKPNILAGKGTSAIAEMPKSPRQIAREEIQRQKQLDKLEEQYQNGEISKFEYNATKWLLNLPQILDAPQPKYSTTA